MSDTKREPLLSDEFMENHADKWNEGVRGITIQHRTCLLQGADWAREHYEAARAKDAELIQKLVDALEWVAAYDNGCPLPTWEKGYNNAWSIANSARTAAEAAGYKPSDQ
jgi:hypothetical protein